MCADIEKKNEMFNQSKRKLEITLPIKQKQIRNAYTQTKAEFLAWLESRTS